MQTVPRVPSSLLASLVLAVVLLAAACSTPGQQRQPHDSTTAATDSALTKPTGTRWHNRPLSDSSVAGTYTEVLPENSNVHHVIALLLRQDKQFVLNDNTAGRQLVRRFGTWSRSDSLVTLHITMQDRTPVNDSLAFMWRDIEMVALPGPTAPQPVWHLLRK
ncbi:MAG TPA: hypothetical protein VHI13_19880 [Candidatus Kapabacteria bacterium]|nr:hypothetical protein [Candidatus Kapabacteria bacterium]